MGTDHSNSLAKAEEIVGAPIVCSVWLETKPLPGYALSSGSGSIPEFILMAVSAAFRYVFPKPLTETETELNYSGATLCVCTGSDLCLIESREVEGTRELTELLQKYSLSELDECVFDYPANTEVRFRFKKASDITLYYIGGRDSLVEFGSCVREQASTGALVE